MNAKRGYVGVCNGHSTYIDFLILSYSVIHYFLFYNSSNCYNCWNNYWFCNFCLIVAYSVYITILRIKKRKLMTPDERELPQIFSIRNSNQGLETDPIIKLRTDTPPNTVDINILDDDEFFGSHKASSLPNLSSFVPQALSKSANNERSTTGELSSPPPARSTLALQYSSHFDRDYHSIERRHSDEEPRATSQSVNPFLPPYSADPYNTAKHIPKWMAPVGTLTDCTSDGRSYYDEHNDFRLEIPEDAIPEGERVTIDIGVALYGPFQNPKGLRTVSPVFWVCVRGCENFHFLKPVKITIEHCLSLDRDTDPHSLGLTFLKGIIVRARIRNISYNDCKEMRSLNSLLMTTTQYCILITFAIYVSPAKMLGFAL